MNRKPNRVESMANATAMMYLAFFKYPEIHAVLANYNTCITLVFYFEKNEKTQMGDLWETLEKGRLSNAEYREDYLQKTDCYSAQWTWILI